MARDPNPFYYAIAPFNAETAHQISIRPSPIVLLLLPKSSPGSAPHELPQKQQLALVQTLTQPAAGQSGIPKRVRRRLVSYHNKGEGTRTSQ